MTKTIKSVPSVKSAPIKDSGAVKVGGASIRFATTKDAGKVHVGGASIRF